jgi:hypothetical protein
VCYLFEYSKESIDNKFSFSTKTETIKFIGMALCIYVEYNIVKSLSAKIKRWSTSNPLISILCSNQEAFHIGKRERIIVKNEILFVY